MTKRDFAALSARILGIYFFVTGVTGIVPVLLIPIIQTMQITDFIQRGAANSSLWMGVSVSLFSIIGQLLLPIVGLLLWFKAEKFAARIFPEESSPTTLTVSVNILPMAFSLTGIIIVALTLPHLLGMFVAHNMAPTLQVPNSEKAQGILDLSASLIQLLLGIWLIFGGGKISTTIQRALSLTRDQ
jgi:hypothetical protein